MLTMSEEAIRPNEETDSWWIAICGDVDRRTRRILRDLGTEVVYPSESVIVDEGARADRFVLVVHGEVEVESHGEVVATLGDNEFFGEVAMLYSRPKSPDAPDTIARTATVRTVRVTRTRELDRRELMTLMDASPKAASVISRQAIGRLATVKGSASGS